LHNRVAGRAFASERHIGKGKGASYARTLSRPLVKAGGRDAHANALSHNCKEPGVTLMLLMSRRHRDMSAILLSTDPPGLPKTGRGFSFGCLLTTLRHEYR